MVQFKRKQHELIEEILDKSDMFVMEIDVTRPGDTVKDDSVVGHHFHKGKPRVNQIIYAFNSYPDLRLVYKYDRGVHDYRIVTASELDEVKS